MATYEETAFEALYMARESTRGTPVTPPTNLIPLNGMITPAQDLYMSPAQIGSLEDYDRSEVMHRMALLSGDGDLDPNNAPFIFGMAAKYVSSPTTPGTLSKLWAYVPTNNADDLMAATSYWGDPNIQVHKGAYTMIDELDIESDAYGNNATKWSVKGTMKDPGAPLVPGGLPSFPAAGVGPLLIPGTMQLWIDTSSAIGTTAVTGRVVSAKHKLVTGVTYKYCAVGPNPTAGVYPSFDHTGRKSRHMETTIVVEVPDLNEYNHWKLHDILKVRVRHNGPWIENVTAVDYYYYVEVDTYGSFDGFKWGEVEKSNRTIELKITSQNDSTLGASWRLAAQNKKATI